MKQDMIICCNRSGGKEHHFEKYGRVKKIVDTSVTSKPAIELKYDDNLNNFII